MRLPGAVLVLAVLTACSSGIRRPQSAQLSMSGTIYAGGLERRGDPLVEASVSLVDASTGETLATSLTSDGGGYRLGKSVTEGQRVVLTVTADGFAPAARALTVGSSTELTLSLALEPLSSLDCGESSCSAEVEGAWWIGPPPEASGRVHAFDLATEHAVTLEVDSSSRVLALGWFELDGGASEDGGAPDSLGELALRLPLSTWSAVEDAVPGSGVLEAPLAWLDPSTGAWQRLDAGVLVSESGLPLPESALDAVHRLEHAGGVVARAPFLPRGFVGVLGAPAPLGCVEGTVSAEGTPALGTLVVSADRAGQVRPNGGFCLEATPGEAPVAARAAYAGLLYTVAALPRPTTPGRCGSTCAQAGTVTLAADALVAAKLCSFSGKVVDPLGAPVPLAQVTVFDETMAGSVFNTFCGKLGTRCAIATSSADDGAFSLKVPLYTRLVLSAGTSVDSGAGVTQRRGAVELTECPAEPLTFKLMRGVDRLEVLAAFSASTVTWTPPRAASRLAVTDAMGTPRWEIASPLGFTPPVTLGRLPPGAVEVTPLAGAAATGDEATVELVGTGRDGVQYAGSASATRP
ncbi:MAG: carboxypeptidase regulatory-like domain-containing protein [Myxococcales bacterium]|nr:carboxypeptidase regulatory-like domain-containing protein [Myxococcales bacterium]